MTSLLLTRASLASDRCDVVEAAYAEYAASPNAEERRASPSNSGRDSQGLI